MTPPAQSTRSAKASEIGISEECLKSIISAVMELLKPMLQTIQQQQQQTNNLIAKLLNAEKQNSPEMVTERNERLAKVNNLVIIGHCDDEGQAREIKKEARSDVEVNELLRTVRKVVADNGGDETSVTEVWRMGVFRAGSRRPIKVKTSSFWTKKLLMKNVKTMKRVDDQVDKVIFARDDLTLMQRDEERRARDQLKSLREINGDKKLVLHRIRGELFICEKTVTGNAINYSKFCCVSVDSDF
jgi:hypothetical protein